MTHPDEPIDEQAADAPDDTLGRVLLPTLETPTLTKAELAELLFERLGLNKRESKDMVEAFFDLIHATLVSGDDPRVPAGGDRPAPPKPVMLPTLETPTLTKAELAELLFERLGLNKRESKDMVEAFFDLIHATLVSGEDVKMSGFGNFNIRRKAPRPGRNPRTGEAIPIKARNVVTFHASHKLKGVVQGDIPPEEEFE